MNNVPNFGFVFVIKYHVESENFLVVWTNSFTVIALIDSPLRKLSLKLREMWFLADVLYVCVCFRYSTFRHEISYTSKAFTALQSWLFLWQLISDFWFYGILNFLEKFCGSCNLCNIRAIVLKLNTNILYRSRTFSIEFGPNRLKHSNILKNCSELSNLCKLRIIELKFCVRMH